MASIRQPRNIYILAFTLAVVTLGVGVVIPIMPFYIEKLGAGGAELGLLVASYAMMRLIFGPLWGGLSDRVGRKPVMLIGVFGYALTMVWFGLASRLWMLFAARILSGILSSATSPTTMAYVGDSTPEKERGSGMGILGAATGVGMIVGPALGGLLAESSLSAPFFIAAGMAMLAMVLIAIFLPESFPSAVLRPGRKKESLNWKCLRILIVKRLGSVLLMTFIMSCGMMLFYGVFGLYALERFHFGPHQVGVIFMVAGLVSALAQGLLAGRLIRRWGEAVLIKAGMLATAFGFVGILAAGDFPALLLAIGFFTLSSSLLLPVVMALTSRRAGVQQGMAMGLSNAAMSLGRIAGPLLGGFVFDADIHLPYIGGAIVMLVGFTLSLVTYVDRPVDTLAREGEV